MEGAKGSLFGPEHCRLFSSLRKPTTPGPYVLCQTATRISIVGEAVLMVNLAIAVDCLADPAHYGRPGEPDVFSAT